MPPRCSRPRSRRARCSRRCSAIEARPGASARSRTRRAMLDLDLLLYGGEIDRRAGARGARIRDCTSARSRSRRSSRSTPRRDPGPRAGARLARRARARPARRANPLLTRDAGIGPVAYSSRALASRRAFSSSVCVRVPLSRYRYIAIDGPIGAGKTSLAKRLAERGSAARPLLEQPDANPFLPRFYLDRARYALPTQLFFLFQRVDQLRAAAQPDLFARLTVADFLLEKDPLFAGLTLVGRRARALPADLRRRSGRRPRARPRDLPPRRRADAARARAAARRSTTRIRSTRTTSPPSPRPTAGSSIITPRRRCWW